MAGSDPDLVVRVAANIQALQTDFAAAAASIKTIEASTTQAAAASAGWTSALNDLGHSFVARIAEGLLLRDAMREFVRFGEEVLTAGEDIKKMAAQTSLTTDEVQRFMYIAGQTNTPVQALVNAVQNLQQRLGDETTGAAGAMARLNINVDTFSKLGAYQQMITLSEAIKEVPDPLDAASIKFGLFGKAWKEVGPAMLADMQALGDQAPQMADSTVESLARIVEAQKHWKAEAVVAGSGVVLAIEGAGFALGDFLSRFNPEHFGVANSALLKLEGELNDPTGVKGALASIKPAVIDVGEQFQALGATSAADLARITAAEHDLKASAEALIVVHKAEAEALKIATDQYAELAKVSAEYYKAVNAASHDTVGREVDDVYVATQAKVDALQKTKAYTVEAEMEMWATADQVANNIIQKTLESDQYTKEHYEKLADEARIAYDFALDHASSFSNAEIQVLAAAYRAAEQASMHWAGTATTDMDTVGQAADAAAVQIAKVQAALEAAAAAAAKANRAMGNTLTYDLTTVDGVERYRSLNPGMNITWSDAQIVDFAKGGGTLQQLVQMGVSTMKPYDTGGPVPTTGPAMLHAGEYIIPKDGALVSGGGGGGVTINLVLNTPLGTPQQIVGVIGPAIVQTLKAQGFRFQGNA